MTIYYAKSAGKDGHKPTVKEHLEAVQKLARTFGGETGMQEEASLAALFHDMGKYTDRFQDVLAGRAHNVDHAIVGAVWLYAYAGTREKLLRAYAPVIAAVAGHHDGLVDAELLREKLEECGNPTGPVVTPSGKEAAATGRAAPHARTLATGGADAACADRAGDGGEKARLRRRQPAPPRADAV